MTELFTLGLRENDVCSRRVLCPCVGWVSCAFSSSKARLRRRELCGSLVERNFLGGSVKAGDISGHRFERRSSCNNRCVFTITFFNVIALLTLLSHGRQTKCGRFSSCWRVIPQIILTKSARGILCCCAGLMFFWRLFSVCRGHETSLKNSLSDSDTCHEFILLVRNLL